MAITITQKPTTPNAAYTRLVYVVSGSTNTSSPQFSYVMDVFQSGSSNRISRITQTVNPAGVAVFDPSRIIQGELSEDQSWKITNTQNFSNSSKKFTLQFGEQYGTSDSSSVTVYPNSTEDVLQTFRGVVDPNDGSYDWQSGSYAVLSNMPSTMSMQQNDYGTIGLYNNSVEYVSQSFYSASFTGDKLVDTKIYNVTGDFVSVPISASTPYWNYVNVEVSSSIGLQNYRYEVSNETHREKVRFAFINKLGTWDYYNNYNPVRQTVEVNREQYTANRVDYSSLTSPYNIERRGLTDYHNTEDDSFTTQTDYLNQTDANWLEELIESPSVYIQRNSEFIPIVILNSSYTANTNQARQKLFQYTIEFIPSNQPFGTWIPEYVNCPVISDQGPPVGVTTLDAYLITTSSALLSGSVDASGSSAITRNGFVYSVSSSTIPVKGGAGVSDQEAFPTFIGNFSASLSSITAGQRYQYRAYSDNNEGTTYGGVKYFRAEAVPFDPTLDGALTSQLWAWFDFSDTGSMVLDGNQPTEVQSKGTIYTGSIYHLNMGWSDTGSVEYNNNGYTSISGGLGYGTGTLSNIYGDSNDWLVFESGSSFTVITVAQDFIGANTGNGPEIRFSPASFLSPLSRRQYSELQFHGFRNNSTPFDTGSLRLQYYLSNETTNNGISSSYTAFNFTPPINSSRTIIYNYSGSNATDIWESRFMRAEFNFGTQDSDITIGRNTTGSLDFNNNVIRTSNGGNGFNIYSDSPALKFNVSQVLIYTGSLSNSQIDSVIDDLKNSNSITFGDKINAVNN